MRKVKTDEEKIAIQMAKLTNDLTLDIEQVGVYLARLSPNVSFRRINEIVEAAKYEKENTSVRTNNTL